MDIEKNKKIILPKKKINVSEGALFNTLNFGQQNEKFMRILKCFILK